MQIKNTFLDPPEISIKQNSCIGCGICEKICPVRMYKVKDKKSSIAHSLEECCLCGQCLAACPNESIIHSGFNLSFFKRISNNPINPEIAFDFLSQRRSVRNYQKDIPPRDLIEKIIEIASYAPGSPHQRVGWVRNFSVVYGYDNMKHVLDMTVEYLQKSYKLIKSPLIRMAAHIDDSARAAQKVITDIEMRLQEYEAGSDAILYNAPIAIFAYAPTNSSMNAKGKRKFGSFNKGNSSCSGLTGESCKKLRPLSHICCAMYSRVQRKEWYFYENSYTYGHSNIISSFYCTSRSPGASFRSCKC